MRKRSGYTPPFRPPKSRGPKKGTQTQGMLDRRANQRAAVTMAQNTLSQRYTEKKVDPRSMLLAGAIMLRNEPSSFLDQRYCQDLAHYYPELPETKQFLSALHEYIKKFEKKHQ
jgi:hypothetical protein